MLTNKHSVPDVWVADDDGAVRTYISDFLSSRGFSVAGFDSGDRVLRSLGSGRAPSVLVLDIRMPGMGGLDVLGELARSGRHIPTIVLSGVGQVSTVVKAVRLGALDYLVKPVDEHELEATIRRVLEEYESTDGLTDSALETAPASSNRRMLQVQAICEQVAPADVPVLILGESGVGKEVLARFIHAKSLRPDPFVKVNCAALPAELLESELFGHERGAFTGAQREKPGKFELAGKGTILLDEIAEMSPLLQAKLLHILQDGEYVRVGGTRTLQSEARILAATNKNLHTLISNGQFREDLYFRLNVITVEVPPLRARSEDIGPLVGYFAEKYRSRYKSTVQTLPQELIAAFSRYHWPGNVRQLENAVKRFLILPDVEASLADLDRGKPSPDYQPEAGESLKELSAGAAERAEKELVLRVLNDVNWNRKQAARRLNICYKSLLNKIHRWDLRIQSDVA